MECDKCHDRWLMRLFLSELVTRNEEELRATLLRYERELDIQKLSQIQKGESK